MFKEINKILVIKLRHIGDVLLSVPAVRALKESFPAAKVSVLVNSGTEDVLAGNPLIDELIIFHRETKGLPAWKRLPKEAGFLRMLRSKGFDMTVDLTGGDRAAVASFVSGAKYRIGMKSAKGLPGKKYFYTHTAGPDQKNHAVLQNLEILKKSGMEASNVSVDFFVPPDAREKIKEIFKKNNISERDRIVHMHPTSRWLFKCWKDEYMAETIEWLIENGMKIILTSSPEKKELEKAEHIVSLASSRIAGHGSRLISLCGRTSIKELGAISEMSALFFGVDSAPMHIAAALNTPVVALFGPSGAFNWGPWDNKQQSITTPYSNRNGLQAFGMHTVIQKSDGCIPCGKDGCEGSKKSRCLDEITPDEVKAVLAEKLKSIRK
ncbi:MAG: putative lipopolysaccharide heptosyltransferase III [Nitrospirae bacterium]|nr:putative lipopolysaccharide heptosyltransferase III [Nitrospirota bacterium]